MEQYYNIPTSDGFEIPGILNSRGKTKKLIVFVHGLTGSMTEAHYYAAKEYFAQRGYDVFRFNLYAGGDTCRKLHTATIADHARDTKTVLEYFSEQYEDIYLAGHSLGGPSIVGVEKFPENLKKIVFWDPAFDTSGTILKCFEKAGIWFFNPQNGKNIEIYKGMYNEFTANTHLKDLERMSFLKFDMFIIFAGECDKIKFKPETDALRIPSIIIEGANHGFTQEGKYEELFERTLEFIER